MESINQKKVKPRNEIQTGGIAWVFFLIFIEYFMTIVHHNSGMVADRYISKEDIRRAELV